MPLISRWCASIPYSTIINIGVLENKFLRTDSPTGEGFFWFYSKYFRLSRNCVRSEERSPSHRVSNWMCKWSTFTDPVKSLSRIQSSFSSTIVRFSLYAQPVTLLVWVTDMIIVFEKVGLATNVLVEKV